MTAISHSIAPSLSITGDTSSPDFTLHVNTAMIPRDYQALAAAVTKEFGDAVTHHPSPAGFGGIDQFVFAPEHIGARKELVQRALGSVVGHLNASFERATVCITEGCSSNCHGRIEQAAIDEAVGKFSAAAIINKEGGRAIGA